MKNWVVGNKWLLIGVGIAVILGGVLCALGPQLWQWILSMHGM